MKRIESQIVYGRDEQMVFYAGQFMTFERMMLTIGLVQLADVVRPAGQGLALCRFFLLALTASDQLGGIL